LIDHVRPFTVKNMIIINKDQTKYDMLKKYIPEQYIIALDNMNNEIVQSQSYLYKSEQTRIMADKLQLLYLVDFNGIKISDVIDTPTIDEAQILK